MFSEKVHRYIYLFGLFSLAFGMMMGSVPTSVPQFILIINWLAEGDFKRKWEQLRSNRVFWVLASVMAIHLCGLFYTSDMDDGFRDIRTKAPLLLLPAVVFSARPLLQKDLYLILYGFIGGSVMNTAWCILYSFVLHHNDVVRDASRFMSHIRLGLYLNIAIAVCVYFVVTAGSGIKKAGFLLLAVYFVFVLYILGLASGLANFVILFLFTLGAMIYRQKPGVKLAGLAVLVVFLGLVIQYVHTIYEAQLSVRSTANNTPQQYAPSGRPYLHFELNGQKENGNYIQINVQPEELQREWERRFPADSFNYETEHNLQRYVILVRYLASKGLNKDSAGVAALDLQDQENIRKGIANHEYPSWSFLHKRTYELVNEYDEFMHGRFVNGHSITMRLYFWKAALHIVREHFLFGVGTGDVQQELNKTYVDTQSPLEEEWYKRPHNQFLTLTVALGITGLFIFLFSLVYPVVVLRNYLRVIYWPFFLIVILSFFLEDTLETQAGLTFYVFFNTLLLSMAYFRRKSEKGEGIS